MLIEIQSPTPVLNTADFVYAFGGANGDKIPSDEKERPIYYEFVALKGTVFQIEKVLEQIYKVTAPFYPKRELYIDSRFTSPTNQFKMAALPSPDQILKKMNQMKGSAYVWGGNWSAGIPEMLTLYPPKKSIDPQSHILWTLKGVDCSGLLYEATNGASPRNTSQLAYYGLSITDLSDLYPLDMIVYPGHVLFVFNKETTIESTYPYGVIERDLTERLNEILKTRQFVKNWEPHLDPEKHFTVRRFIHSPYAHKEPSGLFESCR